MRIRYYFRVLVQLMKLSLMTRLSYRLNGILLIANSSASFVVTILMLQIIFGRTNAVGDWSKGQIFIFFGVFQLFESLFDMIIGRNLHWMSQLVEKGSLDFILTKPINSLFIVSFRDFRLFNVFNVLFAIMIIRFGLNNLNYTITSLSVIMFLLSLSVGLFIYYCFYAFFAALSFWTIRTPFHELLDSTIGVLRFPLDIYGKFWEVFFTFFVPLIFVITVPARTLLGFYDNLLMISPIVVIVLFIITIKFWNRALRSYTSASS